MAFWLATQREGQTHDWIMRFDPRFWSVNFPRPMMASVISTAPDALRVDAAFLRSADLGGLIWESEDRLDHPLLAYRTDRDYAHTVLSFRWRSAGVLPLDVLHGPTLTIEGQDAQGAPHTWYVRLWNYAQGTPENAQITLSFSQLIGGFTLPDEADPVWPHAIDRMFISFAPPGYHEGSSTPLPQEAEGWIELTDIRTEGARAMLEIGDVVIPPHGLAIATGFDDQGVQTPARLIRAIHQLGYRGAIIHYVGMSHYFRLAHHNGRYLCGAHTPETDPLNTPTRVWHRAFFAEAIAQGFEPVASLSYEVLDQHCPEDWKQRDANGAPALTGWEPPSTLLSPPHPEAMAWLQAVGCAFVTMMQDAGARVRFQVGEPWWWTFADGRICLYDAASQAALGGAPVTITDMRQPLTSDQTALLDAAGAVLAQSTAALVVAVRNAVAPDPLEALALVFTPTLLAHDMPELYRANLPQGWAAPAFDRLQVEDYDWLTAGADGLRRKAYALINQRLGYAPEEQDYLAGFVLTAEQSEAWRRIDAGIDEALHRAPHEVVVWALPQVARDGYVRLPPPFSALPTQLADPADTLPDTPATSRTTGDAAMQPFDDIAYPLPLGRDTSVSPEFSTQVSITASGFERRNSVWSDARLRFDVGPGVRSETELGTLIAFFRARRGAARGFRLRDPCDFSSNGMTSTPTPLDQVLGKGDGLRTDFPLIKRYGADTFEDEVQVRRITRPDATSLRVSVDGVLQSDNWSLQEGGILSFTDAPAAGSLITAGFLFDVPVRFAEDSLDINGTAFAAGETPSVPLLEIREAA